MHVAFESLDSVLSIEIFQVFLEHAVYNTVERDEL
jgi:hypothetical protein